MRSFSNFRTSVVAIATIVAMLLIPGCGSLCATMTHCSTSAVSGNSEGCHHTDMSSQSDSDAYSLSAQTSCGQQTGLVAILTGSDSSVQFESAGAANTLLLIEIPAHVIALNSGLHDFLVSKESPQQSIPLENLFILRI